ncbi:hypothetical protein MD484_g1639, partial [Candolleomyces efflorescens]
MSSREEFAYATVRTLYGITVGSFVAIGVQLFMCIYGLSLYFETPKHIRHGRLPYIIISWTIFILFCLSQTGDAVQAFSFLYHGEADDPISILKLRQKDDHTWWRLGSSSCIYLVNWIADGLLLYRCSIIWTEKRWVCIPPGLAYLASMAMSLVTIYSVATSADAIKRINARALSAWIYLSVSLNVVVTILISFRLLRLRKQLSKYLPAKDLAVYLGIVAILVESAGPLALTGIGFAIASNPKTVAGRIPNGLFLCLWFSLNAICPQMIIFRVTNGRSWLRHPEARNAAPVHDVEAVSTNIVFTQAAHIPSTSTQTDGTRILSVGSVEKDKEAV